MTGKLTIHGPISLAELAPLLAKLAEVFSARDRFVAYGYQYRRVSEPFVTTDGDDLCIEYVEHEVRT